jgi:MFS family permease
MVSSNRSIERYALALSVLISFLVAYVSSAINIALPEIATTFSLNSVYLTWIPTSYLLFSAIFLIPFGKIADIYGKKRIILYGLIIFVLASITSAISVSGNMLLISRIFQAIGSAMIYGNVYSLLASVHSEGEAGKPLSISVASAYVGLSVGPILGGFLTEYFGWRSIFLFTIPITVLALLFIYKLMGEWFGADGEIFDIRSTSVLAISLILIMYGFSVITTIIGILCLLIGFMGIVMFIWLQKKVANPLIHPKLLFDRVYIINNLTSLVNYGPGIFTIFLLSLYLQDIRMLNPTQTGLLLCVQSVFIAIASLMVVKLLDFTLPRYIAAVGMALTGIGLALFLFLSETTSLTYIMVALSIIGVGYGFSAASSTEISLKYVEKRFYGVSSATLNTMRVLGQMMGMGVTTAVLAIFIGTAALSQSNQIIFIQSSKIPFLIYAILCFISIYGYFIIRRKN